MAYQALYAAYLEMRLIEQSRTVRGGEAVVECLFEGVYRRNGNPVLIGAHLENAMLVGAHLNRAFLQKATLTGAALLDAHLENADMTGVIGLTRIQLCNANFDETTTLPDGKPGRAALFRRGHAGPGHDIAWRVSFQGAFGGACRHPARSRTLGMAALVAIGLGHPVADRLGQGPLVCVPRIAVPVAAGFW